MANLAIRGHATRGKEIIKILETLGGKNKIFSDGLKWFNGTNVDSYYTIEEDNYIHMRLGSRKCDYIKFTIEEFLEKFPYKVGNKVVAYYEGVLAQFTIQDMRWNYELNKVEYKICSSWLDTSVIIPYKEETMEETNKVVFDANAQCCDIMNNLIKEETMEERQYKELRMPLDDDDKLATEVTIDGSKMLPPNGYLIGKITQVDNGMLVEYVKKQPQYPKTYAECCEVLGIEVDLWFVYEDIDDNHINPACISNYRMRRLDLYHNLEKLIICRDAYWKIAGDEMGLGKP